MQEQTETWKTCEGFADYQVSNLGGFRNRHKERHPKQTINSNGYAVVSIARKGYGVHRLVAAAFCQQSAGCNIVNHLDGNKQNNRADNLEWCTSAQNTAHARDTGLLARGEDAGNSTLSEAQVRQIAEALQAGETAASITERLSVSYEMVCKIKSGRTWGHVTGRALSPVNRISRGVLTDELVLQVDDQLQKGESIAAVAAQFDLGYEAVKKIKAGLTWGHVTGRGDTQKASKTKLTEADVRYIRQRVAAGESIRAIAREYGMSHAVIGAAARGETWKHVI